VKAVNKKQVAEQKRGLEVLAVIPARGGSKGLPRKNILELCGKPLIAYSIEAARGASSIGRVVVSTDDPEIADVARACGAEVPFLRPASLADDRASVGQATAHMLEGLREQGYEPDALAVLYPTSPFRTPTLLDHLCAQFAKGFSSIIAVRRVEHGARPLMFRKDGLLRPLLPAQGRDLASRQPFERRYGLFQGTRFRAANKHFVHFIRDEASLVDIDTLEDFFLAEEIIKSGEFRFEG
jgi:CMP-N-acetylneuraminic acid synthetase